MKFKNYLDVLKNATSTQKKEFDYAPENYEDAMINFEQILELMGDISNCDTLGLRML